MAVVDISGIYFFMPIFSFFFVFLIVYSILAKTKVLGDNKFINVVISFIMSVFFMSFSSLELYVTTIVPWTAVLIVVIFLILLVAGFSSGKLEDIMKPWLAWTFVGVLLIIFFVAAIHVFNPIFHPDLLITSGEGTSLLEQLMNNANGTIIGSLLLIAITIVVSWIITK